VDVERLPERLACAHTSHAMHVRPDMNAHTCLPIHGARAKSQDRSEGSFQEQCWTSQATGDVPRTRQQSLTVAPPRLATFRTLKEEARRS
jgi:hypothetical protein